MWKNQEYMCTRLYLIIICWYLCTGFNNQNDHDKPQKSQPEKTNKFQEPEMLSLLLNYQTVQHIIDSLEFEEASKNDTAVLRLKIELGDIFLKSGNYEESLGFYYGALDIAENLSDNKAYGVINEGISGNYYEMFFHSDKNFAYLDSSSKYVVRALKISKVTNDKLLESSSLNIIGGINIHLGRLDSVVFFLDKALKINRLFEENENLAILHNLAYAHLQLNNFTQALGYAEECFNAALGSGDILFQALALENTADIQEAMGNLKQAERIREQLKDIKANKDIVVQSLMTKQLFLDYKARKTNKALLGASQDRYYFIRLSRILIFTSLILLLVLTIAFYLFRQKRKLRLADIKLLKEQQLSANLKMNNTKLELRTREAEAKTLKNELETKDIELASKLLAHTQINEFLRSLKNSLNNNSEESEENIRAEKLNKLEQEITTHLNKNVWKEFELLYASGSSSFINNLSKEYPKLTLNDKRLCYLIIMGLSTKEISRILKKSYRSVEMARHRLRTKFNLKRDANLLEHLKNFTQ